MCFLACFGFLKVGEMTATPQSRSFIQLHQFTTLKKPQNNVSFDLIPMSTVIKITRQPVCDSVQILLACCNNRGYHDVPW